MDLITIRIQTPPAATVTTVPYETILAHPEQFFQAADIVWVIVASAMVFIMIPSLSLIYAGLSNRSFAMTMFRLPLMTAAVVGLQWVFWGYSLTFTDGDLASGWYGGEKRANGLVDVLARPITVGNGDGAPIPELLFVLYEGMFAAFTASLVCGGVMHRAKPARFLVFITFWSILVYDPVARWVWHRRGWSNQLGVIDFAGGTPVHITSGTTVAAFAIFYDFEVSNMTFFQYSWDFLRRVCLRIAHDVEVLWTFVKGCVWILLIPLKLAPGNMNLNVQEFPVDDTPDAHEFEPYNNTYLVLGTALLWFGWAGFNGGSALGGNLRAVSAWLSTHIAACAGGVVGILWQWIEKMWDAGGRDFTQRSPGDRHADLTVLSFCDGAVAGLVAITPASGYVPVWSAAIFGVVAAIIVGLLKKESEVLLRHDKLQVFAVHAGAGLVGMCLTGVLADPVTVGLDGHSTLPHPEYSKGRRLGYQVADALACVAYTFTMTIAILNFMKFSFFILQKMVSRGTTLRDATGYYDAEGSPVVIVDDLQPTAPQRWRDDIERREAILLESLPHLAGNGNVQAVNGHNAVAG